jgi:hypothetical protein
MTDLEDLVRATLAERADDAPAPDRLAEAVRTRRHRSRRGRQALAVVAVAAATAAAVVIPLTVTGSAARRDRHVTTPAPLPRPSNEQVIGFHGIEITVPASWKMNDLRCGTPIADTVIRDTGGSTHCLIARPPKVNSVELTADLIGTVKSIHQTSDVTNPHGVRLFSGEAGRDTGVIIPTAGVVLFVNASPAMTQRILDSVRRVTTDWSGCKMHESQLKPVAPGPLPLKYQPYIIVPGPTSIAICHYEDNWLVSSTVTTGAAMANVVQTANTAPNEFVHEAPHRGVYVPCATPVRLGGERGTGFILWAHYPDGKARELWFQSDCGALGITNGQRAGALTEGLARAINEPLHRGFGIPGDLLPGPPP